MGHSVSSNFYSLFSLHLFFSLSLCPSPSLSALGYTEVPCYHFLLTIKLRKIPFGQQWPDRETWSYAELYHTLSCMHARTNAVSVTHCCTHTHISTHKWIGFLLGKLQSAYWTRSIDSPLSLFSSSSVLASTIWLHLCFFPFLRLHQSSLSPTTPLSLIDWSSPYFLLLQEVSAGQETLTSTQT